MLNYKYEFITTLNPSVQFRYGGVWVPRHPSTSVACTTMYSFTLDEDESFETLEFVSGWAIGSLRFNTTSFWSAQERPIIKSTKNPDRCCVLCWENGTLIKLPQLPGVKALTPNVIMPSINIGLLYTVDIAHPDIARSSMSKAASIDFGL